MSFRFFYLLSSALFFALSSAALQAAPEWIWLQKGSKNGEKASFRFRFEAPHNTHYASLQLTCDNGATAFLNGQEVLKNPDWQQPSTADVSKIIKPGESNEILVNASNQGGAAALVARLTLKFPNGKESVIETNGQWEAAPTGTDTWKPAVVIAKYGEGPWGDAFSGKARPQKANQPTESIAEADITVPQGFKVERLYNVPKDAQGSWVALTVDDKGRLIACDQYGSIYRMTVPALGAPAAALAPETLKTPLGKAHGLLYAFGSLYVMVNEDGKSNGLYRLTDTTGDDQFDKSERIVTMAGGGEHGLHSMTVSPDGKRIYFNGGNHTELPEELSASRPAKLWKEDHLLPRMWDANGHARGRMAPGGFICSMNPDGSNVELFCSGFRNEFDITFDLGGELFTYDADMEWDIGSPWYRPTRINHCVSGGEFGWRSGAGKWPNYYHDSLPTLLDIGPGSPTGVTSGKGSKFPEKYQSALFVNDWTYGTMWAIHLTPHGASFEAEKEEFVFGKPLPLTDVVIHPTDGAMYFAVGGRRSQSGVYRVTYVGADSTAPAAPSQPTEEKKMRDMLEALHADGHGPEAIDMAWPYLSHSDRNLRFAARVAIEKQPVSLWQERALAETHPQALIEILTALARATGTSPQAAESTVKSEKGTIASSAGVGPTPDDQIVLQQQMLLAMGRLEGADLTQPRRLAALRTLELIFSRLGKPDPDTCAAVVAKLDPAFPSPDPLINRELAQILVFLDSPTIASKTLAVLATSSDDWEPVASDSVLLRNEGYARAAFDAAASRPNKQQIALMYTLRNARAGWTPELRKSFFSWFPRARTWKGGNSFRGFIENIRKEALANFAPESELAELDALSSKSEPVAVPNFVAPKGPGKNYSVDDVLALTASGFKDRDFKNGEAMFRSVMCLTCHRFNGDGGGIGPDVTGVANRYTMRDLLENIVDPSKVISDQYDSHEIVKKDGSIVIGRIVVEENGKVFVMTNPFSPADLVTVSESDIQSRKARSISMMPPGLINSLNQDELLDLLAYLMTGGNASDKAFKK